MKCVLEGVGLKPGQVFFSGWAEPRDDFLIATLKTPNREVTFGEGYGR